MPNISTAFCFDDAGNVYGINPILLQYIARIESDLNPHAINRNQNGSIDLGIMQINSSWVPSMGLNSSLLLSDPCYNIMTGAKILRLCIDRYGYTWEAVGCYNSVSKQRKITYSWKVFDILKTEDRSHKKNSNQDNISRSTKNSKPSQKLNTHPSSLSFSVKDSLNTNVK
jgi:hypothetical protein